MDEKVTAYIEKQSSPQKEISEKLRSIIHKTFPGIKEEIKWGVPVYDGGKYYIGAVHYGVNLGFSVKGLSEAELKLFSGSGKTMRHIKITEPKEINEAHIVKLLHLVKEK
jgi:hypothetical protein